MVSIHAPGEGSDAIWLLPCWGGMFQSTLPVKGATLGFGEALPGRCVSIHAPGEGSDLGLLPDSRIILFQSTLPVKGATSTMRT